MSATFILTNTNHINGSSYRIPSILDFGGMIISQAAIRNSYLNVRGYGLTVRVSSVDIPLTLTDGNYSGEQLAVYLTQKLQQIASLQNVNVLYNPSNLHFYVSGKTQNTSSDITITLNDSLAKHIGFDNPVITLPHDDSVFIESTSRSKTQPGFYRIESHSLQACSFGEDVNPASGIIAIVPVTGGFGDYSQYKSDSVFSTEATSAVRLHSVIDLRIYVENTNILLEDPEFVLQFQLLLN